MKLTPKYVLLIAFLIGLSIRIFIESFSIYPIGCDVPVYAYQIELYLRKPSWDLLYLGSPLMFVIGAFLKFITGIDSLTIWKFISPVLNGVVGLSFAYFSLKGLKWDLKKTLFATLFFLFYFVQIIHSNGLFSQQLATIFFFLGLTYYFEGKIKNTILSSILIVLSHQLIPILFFGIIFFCTLKKKLKHQSVISDLKILPIIPITFFLFTFFLPSLSSNNVLGETIEYFSGFLFSGAYGGVTTDTGRLWWLDMYNHFFIYCGLLLLFVFIGLYKNDILLSWLIITLTFSFIPLGWTYKRWQWLLTQPFTIFAVNGMFRFKKFKYIDFVKYIILVIIIIHGIFYSVNPNTIIRSSSSLNEIPEFENVYNNLSHNITDNTLLITSDENFRFYQLLTFRNNQNLLIIRISMIKEIENNLYIYCTAVRGLDFYVFRQKTIKINVVEYDKVFFLKDHYTKSYFTEIEHFFVKINQFGEVEIYEFCSNR